MYIALVDKLVELLGVGSVISYQFHHPWAYLIFQQQKIVYYLLPGTLAYSHIFLCHCGDSRIHQTTEIVFFLLFSFILIALSSTAIIIL